MVSPIEVLSRALSATRLRVNVIASNMANAETTRTAEGGPYKRKDVVQVADKIESSFGNEIDRATLASPRVLGVIEDQSEGRKVFQPGHPDADKEGFVAYPNINVVTTMTDLMSATRLYQANATAIETIRTIEREAGNISQG